MKSWFSPKVKRGLPSKINGRGIFAHADLSKDEIIAVKAGHLLTLSEVQALPFAGHSEIQLTDDIYICPVTPEERDESMLYINHSCEPNSGMRGDVVFVAMKDIPAGEEITIDYVMLDSHDYEMACSCGAKRCRKIVRGSDYKLPAARAYGKYLSAYIQSRLGII
jgi:hypothetical protein